MQGVGIGVGEWELGRDSDTGDFSFCYTCIRKPKN